MLKLVGTGGGSDSGGGSDHPSEDGLDGRLSFSERGRPYRVLVVGDWGVEDRWLTSPAHSAPHSAGVRMRRSLAQRGDATQQLWGAGATAAWLHAALARVEGDDPQPLCDVLGAGIWSSHDTRILKGLFDPIYLSAKTPLRVHRPDPPAPHHTLARVRLYDLAKALPDAVPHATLRVMRVFEPGIQVVVERDRIEWEVGAPYDEAGRPSWTVPGFDWASFEDAIDGEQESFEIDAVLVDDRQRGVIGAPLLRFLKQKCLFAEWFVATSSHDPSWLAELEDVALRLLVVRDDPVSTGSSGATRWVTARGAPTREALEDLASLLDRLAKVPQLSVVVLPERGAALGVDRRSPKEGGELSVVMPRNDRASRDLADGAVLGGLVANLMRHPSLAVGEVLGLVLGDLSRFESHATDRLLSRSSPLQGPRLALAGEQAVEQLPHSLRDLREERRAWQSASRSCGVVERGDGRRVLELWRAMQELEGFVVWERTRRMSIGKVSRALGFCSSRDPGEPTPSALLWGPAGSGRSTLARALAREHGMTFLSIEGVRLPVGADLAVALAAEVAEKTREDEESLLVHVDLTRSTVGVGALFEALESLDRGDRLAQRGLAPRAWLVASETRENSSEPADRWRRVTEAPSLGSVDLSVFSDPDEGHLERMFLGVRMLRETFPEVLRIDYAMVDLLMRAPLDVATRELADFVGALQDVREGRVGAENVPRGASLGGASVEELLSAPAEQPRGEWVEIVD
ncbi:ATP-binding protein [Myxococcota bacterium]|nr:ATP-binding protein [Myxococcota bacterium]